MQSQFTPAGSAKAIGDAPDQPRCAVITGAGGGIGRATAAALATRGMRLLLVGRDAERLRSAAAQIGGDTAVLAADLTEEAGIAAVAAATRPHLHLLVHSAGQYQRGPVATLGADAWRALDAINLHAPLLLTAACLPQLRAAGGDVVFINSSAGMRAGAGLAAYAAGKHGLRAAVDALRQEVNGDGIRVLSIFPGRTATPMQDAVLAAEGRHADPDRLLRPDDVAQMLLAALALPRTAEVTDIVIRPMRPL